MRQVPHYLIIGNGRLAKHFLHYFNLLGLSASHWYRHSQNKLDLSASHILLLISDDAIEEFIQMHLSNTNAYLIHCSGSLVTDKAIGAHPLMTFNHDCYALSDYQAITFVLDDDAPAFDELFPDLPNHHVRLNKNLKTKYHALCVMAGNFSCMLWQKLMSDFENEFNLSADIAHPYLLQQTKNIMQDYKTALTGPLARGDVKTMQKNMDALKGDIFQDIYEAFVIAKSRHCEERLRRSNPDEAIQEN